MTLPPIWHLEAKPSYSEHAADVTCFLQVNAHDEDDEDSHVEAFPTVPNLAAPIPSSPPPSFHSRSSSPSSHRLLHEDPMRGGANNDMEDAFDDGGASDDDDEPDDRQRLMRGDPTVSSPETPAAATATNDTTESPQSSSTQRRGTLLPTFSSSAASRVVGLGSSNDGVFANLNAKPERGEKDEDLPPVQSHLFKIVLIISSLTFV